MWYKDLIWGILIISHPRVIAIDLASLLSRAEHAGFSPDHLGWEVTATAVDLCMYWGMKGKLSKINKETCWYPPGD